MNLAAQIDHTLLRPDATQADITQICEQAVEHSFFGVCVHSAWVSHATSILKQFQQKNVQLISVVGFPLGMVETHSKAFEAGRALDSGAQEIDMVINFGFLKSKEFQKVIFDIQAVARVCEDNVLKVILETALLTDEEKRWVCHASVDAGADFVKTCTGFQGGRAEVKDIKLMREVVGSEFGVKASGGIKTQSQALELLQAGANRLGTSSGISIVQNTLSTAQY